MRTFELHRVEDETGVSGTGIVAQGCVFDDGQCAMRWINEPRTTTIFPDLKTIEHIHGHGGKTRIVHTGDALERGYTDCIQDGCENAPFASVGGLDKRDALECPKYITPGESKRYLAGYGLAALTQYGADWKTCTFSWAPALTIDPKQG